MNPLMPLPMDDGKHAMNGEAPHVPRTKQEAEELLTGPAYGLGYKPRLPSTSIWAFGSEPPPYYMVIGDVPAMHNHPQVNLCLSWYCAGIHPAKFNIRASSPDVEQYVYEALNRWWTRALYPCQWVGYSWGYCPGELKFCTERGFLKFEDLITFSPHDARILTEKNIVAGVRVRSANAMGDENDWNNRNMTINLWGPKKGIPAKGFWFIHNPRYNQYYGWTQLYGAWRPWRFLATPNGAEEVLEGAMYRLGFQGPMIRFPKGSERTTRHPSGATDTDNRIDNRDIAVELGENMKAGAVIAMSSETVDGSPGMYKWDAKIPTDSFKPDGLITNCEFLNKAVAIGIGLPYEMFQGGTSGGYNGRDISKESYYISQQWNANHQVRTARIWWLDACVEFNFGPDAWYEVEVASLLETQQLQATGMSHMPGAPAAPGQAPQQSQQPKEGQKSEQTAPQNQQQPEQKPGFDISALYGEQGMALDFDAETADDFWLAADVDQVAGHGRHAPPGGITIGGKFYKPGEFIPGIKLAQATDEEKKELASKSTNPMEKEGTKTRGGGHAKSKKQTDHDYGSLFLRFKPGEGVTQRLKQLSQSIGDFDLATEGREKDFHITVLHGLTSGVTPNQVEAALHQVGEVQVDLGKTGHFPSSGDGDVVLVECQSPQLTYLHAILASQLPHVSTHPEYKPHVTLGYVVPGHGEQYDGIDFVDGWNETFPNIIYSDPNGTEHEIKLSGQKDMALDSERLLDVPDVRQQDDYSCGAAAAMSAARYFGVGPESLEDWKKELRTTKKESTDPKAIVEYLIRLGLDVQAKERMTIRDLEEAWREGKPVICPIQEYGVPSKQASFKYGHYVVVIGIGMGNNVFVQDPSIDNVLEGQDADAAPGRMMIDEKKWLEVWHDHDASDKQYERYGIIVGKK